MGLLDSDLGYQIGLLAGGLWAERYRQRGEEKKAQQEQQTQLAQNPFYQSILAQNNNLLNRYNQTNPYAHTPYAYTNARTQK